MGLSLAFGDEAYIERVHWLLGHLNQFWVFYVTVLPLLISATDYDWILKIRLQMANKIPIKRAGIYNSRPRMLMFAELRVGQSNLLHKYAYSKEQRERFRDLRKLTHHDVQKYQTFQDDENKIVVYDALETPEDFVSPFERYAVSAVSIIGFGRQIASTTDPVITEILAYMQNAAHVGVIAKDFPRVMEEDSYSKYLFREAPKYNLKRTELASLAENLLGADVDIFSSTLVPAVLAMQELVHFVRTDRSPENDYYIPKGTWVQGNVWAVHHNEREFPEPDRFNPRRFLESEDARPFPGEKRYMAFGWGRRSCAGQTLAEQGTFTNVSRLLWAFKGEPAIDAASGTKIPPFSVKFVPPNDTIRRTIEQEGERALEYLSKYDRDTKYRFSAFL
ncbi:cytochrome P450 [Phaeosphaeriaceae sp. PMI808]|nr:cytochrome P450 [Phaeosphaeriaceae sp. PMI808]